jgi:hypothetical protein
MICAPRAEASRIFSIARERFSSALVVQRICTSPTVNLLAMIFSLTSGASGGEWVIVLQEWQAAHADDEKMRVNILKS